MITFVLSKVKKRAEYFFASVWVICIVVFLLILYLGTSGFNKTVDETSFGKSNQFVYLMIGSVILGIISFLILLLILLFRHTSNTYKINNSKVPKSKVILKLIIILPILPVYLFFQLIPVSKIIQRIRLGKKGMALKKILVTIFLRILALVGLLGLIFPIWITGYLLIWSSAMNYLGYYKIPLPVSGTGSMYPTFPKSYEKNKVKQSSDIIGIFDFSPYPNGLVLFGKRYLGYELQRGDIVDAENQIIRESVKKLYGNTSGVIKRIIAMPGDTLELREGIVYLNEKPLLEPYTAKPHSTFGGKFLDECKNITIPENKLFIMGDNRKGSGDSREFGFVEVGDIKFVIPIEKQKEKYDKNYRDISNDLSESTKTKLNKEKYLELLNAKRQEAGAKPLKYQTLLEKSAAKRGQVILAFNDFSFEATKSGTTMEQAMYSVGYSNIIWGEAPTQGYFDADELIENQFEFPETVEFLLNKDYQEFGVAEIEGEINNCPTQVIVQHFAGYVPPNYKKEDVEGWESVLGKLKEIQPGWSELKNIKPFYDNNRQDVDKINEIIGLRITNIEAIVNKMRSNKWLSKQEIDYTYRDEALGKEQEEIASKLNRR